MTRVIRLVLASSLALAAAACGLKDTPDPAPPLMGDKTREPTAPAERRGVDQPDNPLNAENPTEQAKPF